MAGDGRGVHQAQKAGNKSQRHQGDQQRRPNHHGARIACDDSEAEQHGRDGIRFAVVHEWNGHHADREDEGGEQRTDPEVGDHEFDVVQTHDRRDELTGRGQSRVVEHGENHHRGSRPDQPDDAGNERIERNVRHVSPPYGERCAQARRFALLDLVRQGIQAKGQDRRDQHEGAACRQRQPIRGAIEEGNGPADQGKGNAVEQAIELGNEQVGETLSHPRERSPRRDAVNGLKLPGDSRKMLGDG